MKEKLCYDNVRLEVAFVLSFIAIPFTQILYMLVGKSIDLTNILFLADILLVINARSVFSGNLCVIKSRSMIAIVIYQILVLVYAIYADVAFTQDDYGIIYTLYTLLFAICLMTNNHQLNGRLFINLLFWTTGIMNIFLLYVLTDAFSSFSNFYINSTDVSDRSILSGVAYTFLTVCLVHKSGNKIISFIKIGFVFFAVNNMLATSRRGGFLALIAMLIYWLFVQRKKEYFRISVNSIIKMVISIPLIIFILYLFGRINPYLGDQILRFYERITNALSTFIGNSSTDAAAAARVSSRKLALNDLKYANGIETLFGYGYMHRWIDFPFLQAFQDMGILGGIYYLGLQLIIPVHALFMKSENEAVKFLQLNAIGLMLNNFYTGFPYGNTKFISLTLLAYVVYYVSDTNEVIVEEDSWGGVLNDLICFLNQKGSILSLSYQGSSCIGMGVSQ